MNQLNLFGGRNGMDDLNKFLMLVAVILMVLCLFIRIKILTWITILLLVVIYARAFSRAFEKRAKENQKFLEIAAGFMGNKNPKRRQDVKAAKEGKRVLICPYCKEKLRVPVGAGTIKIQCPHCKREFEETV